MNTKKVLALISVVAMMSTMASFNGVMGVDAEVTQIFNDTFEDGFDNWSTRGDASIEVTSDYSNSGSNSLYITGRTKGWHGAGCSKIKELRAGQTYSLSSYVMFQEGNDYEQINFAILYKDANGTEQYKQIANANVKKGEWTQIKGDYTIPSDASNVTLYFETPSNLIDFYIDDITAEGEPYDNSDITYGYNDDFETDNNGWGSRGSETVERVSTEAHSGSYSMYTSNRTQLWNAPGANKTLQLEKNGYYKFGIWVKYNDEGNNWADTHKFQLYIQYTADGKDNYVELGNAIATKGEWTYIEAKYTIPEGASNFVIYAQTGYVPDASVTPEDLMNFYIDDATCEPLEYPKIQEDIPSLNDVYADYFKIGFATTPAELRNEAVQNIMKKHTDYMTIGNELKPDSVLNQSASQKYYQETGDDTNPQISLDKAKTALEFAEENNISVRGHVLVWHSQTPDWFFKEGFSNDGDWVSKEVMIKRLENYIKNVMETIAEEYPNVDFYAWDVVNEAFKDTGGMRDAGSNNVVNGQSAWVQVFGDDSFIDYAFEFAREYAPEGCKLFYNDYNEYIPTKRDDICEKVAELKEKGLIDGVGMQSHIKMGSPSIELYEEAIRKYADLGVEVQITELDIDQKSNSASDLSELAERYQEVFAMYKKVVDDGVNLNAVTIWGINDGNSWIGGYPLLFDDDFQAKACYYAIVDTDSEIQGVKNVNAIMNDGSGLHFDVQAENKVGDNSFKVAWNDKSASIEIQVTSAVAQDVTIYFNGIVEKVTLGAEETKVIEVIVDDLSLITDDTFDFDIAFGDTAWNDLSYSAETGFTNLGTVTLSKMQRYTEAIQGTPTVDGEIDEIWSTANKIETDNYTMGSGATAKVKTLWDKDYIYVLAEVTDINLSKSNANVYEQDTVEIFFDENNNKTSAYQGDDIQCRVNFDNEKTVTDGLSTDNFISATSITDTGYIVEFAIPSTLGGFDANQVVGFDAQVNDDDGSGERTSIANWNDLTGLGYTNTSNYGLLKLLGNTEPVKPSDDYIKGDVNDDGDVKSNDLLLLKKYLLGLDDLSERSLKNADLNDDNDVKSNDLLTLKKYLLGLVEL